MDYDIFLNYWEV